MPLYLVAQSELPEQRDQRRANPGKSSGETYKATLEELSSGARIDLVEPADRGSRRYSAKDLSIYDAIFLTGSPMHVYHETAEVDRQLDFMKAVFAARVPSFGSCAGLQIAVAAAGGTVRKMANRMEAGIARRITATDAGRTHPLLRGRPACWDAAGLHGDEVARLPQGATLLASNSATAVQAAEVRYYGGVFWGVQYHPELSLREIAIALKAQASDLVSNGLVDEEQHVFDHADDIEALHRAPQSRVLRWRLGIDAELAEEEYRRREIINFIAALPSLKRSL